MKRDRVSKASRVLAAGFLFGAASLRAGADPTTLLRELAKNEPPIVILYGGASAEESAKALQAAILQHNDAKKKKPADVPVVPLAQEDEVQRAMTPHPKGLHTTYICLVARNEWSSKLPESVAARMPLRLTELKPGQGAVKCSMSNAASGKLAFNMALIAPDGERLRQLKEILVGHGSGDYRTLSFGREFDTYKIAVFSSPENQKAVEGWAHRSGANLWTDRKWIPLAECGKVPEEDLREYHQAFFLDRSQKEEPLPERVSALLGAVPLKPTTTFIKRQQMENGLSLAVFSVPTTTLLESKVRRHAGFESITGGQVVEDARDLRSVTRSTVIVGGVGPTREEREVIRLEVAKKMRDLRLPVDERGEVLSQLQEDIALQELLGATGTSKLLREKGRIRYVWHYAITDYRGGVEYRTSETQISRDEPPSFERSNPRPREPQPDDNVSEVGGGRRDAIARRRPIYEREHREWEDDMRRWQEEKRRYEERVTQTFPSQWARKVTAHTSSSARGILRLIDLEAQDQAAKVIWESECSGSDSAVQQYQGDTVTVRGVGNRPNSLPAPPNADRCPPEYLRRAAVGAAQQGLERLTDGAILPDGTQPPPPPPPGPDEGTDDGTEGTPPMPPPMPPRKLEALLVAAVVDGTVIITLPAGTDLKAGDRAKVVLLKEIKHPMSDEVLRTVEETVIVLRVERVEEKSFEGRPASPAEAAKLEQVKAGMLVKTWRPAPAPPKPAAKTPAPKPAPKRRGRG
jgi:hypothetical protein